MIEGSETSSGVRVGVGAAEIAGHPRALFLLFFVELWERFSYYGMRALLVFYLTRHFLLEDRRAFAIYGAYTSLAFVTPVIGGYLADRYLGARRAVLFGGVLLTLGHLLMAFEGGGGAHQAAMFAFYVALSLIVVGVGFLKANVSVLVGQLYGPSDTRRDPGFTIFYIGINVGAALGPLLCGWLGETYGWSYGFGAAGIGMAIGLIAFTMLRHLLDGLGDAPAVMPAADRRRNWLIYGASIAAVLPVSWLIAHQDAVGLLLLVCAGVTMGGILWVAFARLTVRQRKPLLLALFLIALQPLFWGLYEQAGSSLNLFTDRHVDRRLLGVEVPASIFQSLSAIYIVLIAPLFAWGWAALDRRGLEPSTPAKFGLALVQVGLGFLVLVAGAAVAGPAPLPIVWILLLYLFHVGGELCLSPVGIAAMTRLAPPTMVGLVMGTWFLATAAGNFIGGLIAQATGGGAAASTTQVIAVYARLGWLAVGVGVLVLLIAPVVMRLARVAPED